MQEIANDQVRGFIGLSTEDKPSINVPPGSWFLEADSGAMSYYNDGGEWMSNVQEEELPTLPTLTLSEGVWALDADGSSTAQAQAVSTTSTAKTLTISNVHATADVIEIGLILTMTTGCDVTFTDVTFADGDPTLATDEVWAFAFTSLDNGTSFYGKYTQLA